MGILEKAQYIGDHLQISLLLGTIGPEAEITYANKAAASLFNHVSLQGIKVADLLPCEGDCDISEEGTWKDVQGTTQDGSHIEVQTNICLIEEEGSQFFLAILRDRTEELRREQDLAEALAEAEAFKKQTEESLAQQETLSQQVSLLLDTLREKRDGGRSAEVAERRAIGAGFDRRQLFVIIIAIMVLVGGLSIVVGISGEQLATIERILLVMVGSLGSLAAGVIDPRNKA